MFDFNDFVLKRINSIATKAMKLEDVMKDLEMETERTSVFIDFYVMNIGRDGVVCIPIGTPEKPYGISLIKDSYILFVYDKRPVALAHSEELKQYIKNNFKNLNKIHSDEYKLAVDVKLKKVLDAKMAIRI
jgi:hypothetical protein